MSGQLTEMNDTQQSDPAHSGRAQVASPASSTGQSLLIDENGLRPIWRLLTYLAAFCVLRFIAIALAGELAYSPAHSGQLALFFLEEALILIAALAPALLLSKLEGRRFGAYGLPARGAFGMQFWCGAAWGIMAVTVLILSMRALGLVGFSGLAIHGLRALKFAVFWGVFFLIVGLYEDFLFRGYSLATLSKVTGFWPAAMASSVIFGSIHLENRGEGWAGILGAAAIGLFFCLTLRRTGTLWFAVGMHMSWDWCETYLYSVPDSGLVLPGHLLNSSFHGPVWLTGGSVGPEGSVLVFVLIGLIALVFDHVYPAKKVEGISNLPNAE